MRPCKFLQTALVLGLCTTFVPPVLALDTVQAAPAALPNVVIVATGGTIAGTGASSTQTVGYAAAKVGVDRLIEAVPELKKVANVRGEQIFQVASENMTTDLWLKLGKRVNQLLAQGDVDGIVITHGTDTLEETAYFLNLVVKSSKPVVLVGAMRPSTAISADGPINLYNATVLAGSKAAAGKGVLVALNDQINGGRDVTKTNTSTADTFRTPDLGFLGYLQDNKAQFYREPIRKHTTGTEFDITNLDTLPRVDIVYGYASATRTPVDAFVAAGAKGIVHAGVGDGSVHKDVMPGLSDARKKGVIIVRSSRVGSGIIARNGEADDDKLDFVVSDISIAGICTNTRAWVTGLQILLSSDRVKETTLLCLEGRVSGRRLLSLKRRHCPQCTVEAGLPASSYQRLLWTIEAVAVCPTHGNILEELPQLLEYRRARWRMREDPIRKAPASPAKYNLDSPEDLKLDLARARLVQGFLESSYFRHGAAITPEKSVAKFLRGACKALYQGVGSHLAKQLLVSKGGLYDWMNGLHLPSFGQVVDIAQALNCSIEAVLLGDTTQLPMFPPEFPKRLSKNPVNFQGIGTIEFREKLIRTIRKRRMEMGKYAPVSVSEIARIMKVDRQSLMKRHPDISKKLTRDYHEKKTTITLLTTSIRHHAYREAAYMIARRGLLPTRNRVMEMLDQVSVFSLCDIKICHRICLEVRAELGIIARR